MASAIDAMFENSPAPTMTESEHAFLLSFVAFIGDVGLGVNNWGVIVGGSGAVSVAQGVAYQHAFIWQNGQIQDLNTLIPANSPLTLNVAYAVSDTGIVAGLGTNAKGETHAFVLVSGLERTRPAICDCGAATGRAG